MSDLIEMHVQPGAVVEIRDQDGGLIQIPSEVGSPFSASAQAAAAQAQQYLDQFTDLYLGAKTSHPTADNDGNPLQNGAIYLNTANDQVWFYDQPGSQWIPAGSGTASAIQYTPHGSNTATDVQAAIDQNVDAITESVRAPAGDFSGNLDSISETGIFRITTGVSGGWGTAGPGDFVIHLQWNANSAKQIGHDADGSEWTRQKSGGTWGQWEKSGSLVRFKDGSSIDASDVSGLDQGVHFFKISGSPTNIPPGINAAGDVLQTIVWNSSTVMQIYYDWSTSGPTIWQRSLAGGIWSQWIAAGGAVGVKQAWTDVTASRQANVAYQNLTGRPIAVSAPLAHGSWFEVSQDGIAWLQMHYADANQDYGRAVGSVIVPAAHYYRVNGGLHTSNPWTELR